MSTQKFFAARQGVLPFEDVGVCLHTRTTVSTRHTPVAEGRACNHDETCDACGLVVAVESWNLDRGAAAHAAAYPVPRWA